MSISVPLAGSWKQAAGAWVSDAGQWVEIPLGTGAPSTDWTRPTDWVPMTVTPGEQKIQLLVAVLLDYGDPGKVLTVNPNISAGTWVINWGDGTSNSTGGIGAQATHLYNPANLPGTDIVINGMNARQALVTLTPSGGNLTNINLTTAYWSGKSYKSQVMEIVYGPSTINGGNVSGSPLLHRVEYLSAASCAASAKFQNCTSLREVVGPTLTVSGTGGTSLFQGCSMLKKVPTINLTGTVANSMFQDCKSLVTGPTITGGTSCTNFSSMFYLCTSLQTVPLFDTSQATTVTNMFNGCTSLLTAPAFNFSKVTSLSAVFSGCSSLISTAPSYNVAACTNLSSMFMNCVSLVKGPGFVNSNLVTNFQQMFTGCSSLVELQAPLNLSSAPNSTAMTAMINNCTQLRKLVISAGPSYTFSIAACCLDAASLDAIYTALPTVTGQTITVTSNPGGLSDTPSIATAKGWTVTGS